MISAALPPPAAESVSDPAEPVGKATLAPRFDPPSDSVGVGAKALQAARESGPSAAGRQALSRAIRYPEGTGLRLLIKNPKDADTVKKFARAKIEN